jgi:hypothetical protein
MPVTVTAFFRNCVYGRLELDYKETGAARVAPPETGYRRRAGDLADVEVSSGTAISSQGDDSAS